MQNVKPTNAGKAIVSYLQSRGIRQTWLARQLELKAVSLNRTLHGTNGHSITRTQVEAIADALDVNASTRREWLALLTTTKAA